jgi:hypothetical protein
MHFRLGVLLPAVVALGCAVGTTANKYPPALGPAGAYIRLSLRRGPDVKGELLAVGQDALLVLRAQPLEQRLVRVPIEALDGMEAPGVRYGGSGLPAERRERLRLISRYPQGVAPELERRLLEAYRQDSVIQLP